MSLRLFAIFPFWLCMIALSAQDIEETLDIITLIEEDGQYFVSKTNRDTSYTVTLDSIQVIEQVLEQYRAELSRPDNEVDLYKPFRYIIAPIYPLREQVLVYSSGDFSDFVIEALCPEKTLDHEGWKQHNYLIRSHSFYHGTSPVTHAACVDRSVAGDGTAIAVEAADSTEQPAVLLARDIRDNFGGAIVDLSDVTLARTTCETARIIHLGPIAELNDDGFYLKRRLDLHGELVTYLSDDTINHQGIDHLLSSSIKSLLISSDPQKIEANRRMINKYYKQLFDGDRKHDALATAIRHYIRNVSGSDKAHPYYWSSIRQYGDIKSIDGNVPSRLYWLLIVIMIVLFVILRRSGGKLY